MHMTLPHFAQSLGGCSLISLSHCGTLPRFAQPLGVCSLTLLSHWGDAPSLHSVTGCTPSLCLVAGGAPLLRSVAGGGGGETLPRFAQLLSIQWFHQIANFVVSYIRFNAYDNGMGTSLIAFLAAHHSIYRYVASLLALKFRSSHREQNASLIALSSSFSLLAQETWLSLIYTVAYVLGPAALRPCSGAGNPHPLLTTLIASLLTQASMASFGAGIPAPLVRYHTIVICKGNHIKSKLLSII